MNIWTGMGRLTRDPEIRHLNDKKTASFTLAVDDYNKTEFINCVAWEKRADFVESYLTKGTKVAVTGKLHVRSWDKAGEKRYITEVIINSFEFCESKRTQDTEGELSDDDLPF